MLDRLTIRDRRITDTAGRDVILRGVVSLTGDHRGPVELTEANFDQLASWGVNSQAIRLEGCRLGVLECDPDPAYLDKLDHWVTWAAERGIYSMFKMTTYDVPSLGTGRAFDRDTWQRFWDSDEIRTDRIDAWRRVWERFAGRAEVIGYDILNEPFFGTDTPKVTSDNLYPFYEDVSRALREIDTEAFLLVQPIAGMGMFAEATGITLETPHGDQVAISDPLAVFVPHFYPDILRECSEDEYEEHLRGFFTEAEQAGTPMLIPEYGLPHQPFQLGRQKLRTWNQRDERLKEELFDRHAVGRNHVWYIDEGFWALCGPNFEETERVEEIVRLFPQRVAGRALGWSYDRDSGPFVCRLDIDAGVDVGPTVISVPGRLYPSGASVEIDGSRSDLQAADDRLVIPASTLSAGGHEVVISR